MRNVVIWVGSSDHGNDLRNSAKIVRSLDARFPKKYRFFFMSKVRFAKTPEIADEYPLECIYDSPDFTRTITEKEIREIENWLGYPLRTIRYHNRFLRYYVKNRSTKDIQVFLARLVRYFRGALQKIHPSHIIMAWPGSVAAMTAKMCADRLGIKLILWGSGRFHTGFILENGEFEHYKWNQDKTNDKKIFRMLKKDYAKRTKPIYFHVTSRKFVRPAKIIQAIRAFSRNMKKYKNLRDERVVYPRTQDFLIRVLLFYIRKSLTRFYLDRIGKRENFFLYPMHWQEDIAVCGPEPFFDQVDLVKTIAKCLPFGYKLYVKPHPAHLGTLSLADIRAIKKIPDVKFVHKTNIFQLLNRCKLLFTLNSTSGIEAMILGKPVVTFGHGIYAKPELAHVVRDMSDLGKIIFKALNEPINEDARMRHIASIYRHTIRLDEESGPLEVELSKHHIEKITYALDRVIAHQNN